MDHQLVPRLLAASVHRGKVRVLVSDEIVLLQDVLLSRESLARDLVFVEVMALTRSKSVSSYISPFDFILGQRLRCYVIDSHGNACES